MRFLPSILPALLATLVLITAGCGGGSSGPAVTGRMAVTINWPDRSRLVPVAAESITVIVSRGGQTVATQTIPRPSSGNSTTADFNNLKVGQLSIQATAYPNPDGSGVAQATGTVPVTIVSGQTAQVTLTMATTIDHVEIVPLAPSVAVGQTATLIATAKDVVGNVVLTLPQTITWTTADASRVGVDAAGVVTGIKPTGVNPGPVTVTVKETESNKSASVPVIVTSGTTVAINPNSGNVPVGDPFSFSATVNNAPDTTVTWSVREAGGGSITQAGVYTAPATAATYHVVATSNYDNSVSATATIVVESGNVHAVIN